MLPLAIGLIHDTVMLAAPPVMAMQTPATCVQVEWRALGNNSLPMNGQKAPAMPNQAQNSTKTDWEDIFEANRDMVTELAQGPGRHGRFVFKKPAA